MSQRGRVFLGLSFTVLLIAALAADCFVARGSEKSLAVVARGSAPPASALADNLSIGGPASIQPGAGLRPHGIDASFWRLLPRLSPGSDGAGDVDPAALVAGLQFGAASIGPGADAAPQQLPSLVSQHVRLQV